MRLALLLAFSVTVFAQSAYQVNLSWVLSTTPGAGTQVERADGACGAPGQVFVILGPTLPTPTNTFSDSTVARGKTYCYRLFAVAGSDRSLPSSTVGAAIPGVLVPPSGFTATTTTATIIKDPNGNIVAQNSVTVTIPLEGQ